VIFKSIKIIVFLLLIFISNTLLSQNIKNNHVADCGGAVEIYHLDTAVVQFSGGYGFIDELIDVVPELVETNSVWIKIEPRLKGELNIHFTPNSNFDFQYFLFKDTTGMFCNKDFDYIRLDYFIKGDTLNKSDDEHFLPQTISCSIETNVDDVYYLLLHSKQEHQNTVSISFDIMGEIEKQNIIIQNYKNVPSAKSVRFKIRDKETGEPVLANVTIKGMRVDNKLFLGSDFIFDAYKSPKAEVVVNAEGYFYYVSPLNFPTNSNSEITIELERLAPGKTMPLEGLKFEQNSRDFIPTSYVALRRLLDFMILNESVKIEIIGHVNAPGYDAKGKVKKLSEDRAKTAYLYLIENGISKDRVKYSGKGNSEMIYLTPKNKAQEEANRRVEIKILEVK
jgi:outer membrane protein OmpA-like peptidoglycan-associated protein